MEKNKFDVVVIGGGPAGYISAIKAARIGGKVALVEKDVVGGACLNRGCIPTKTFLKSAEIINQLGKADARGIVLESKKVSVDMKKAVKEKNKIVKKLTSGVEMLLKSNQVALFKGTGVLAGDGKVVIDNNDIIEGKSVILAGGSQAVRLNIPGFESSRVLTSNEILDLDNVPESLLIVGGGVIGVEMALIFSSFGCHVDIVELGDRILPFMDRDISKHIKASLEKHGIGIATSRSVDAVKETGSGLSAVFNDKTEKEYENILLSVGRKADLSCAGDQPILVEKGKIVVNDHMETSIKGVYAPGDINGRKMLAHAAFKMGEFAAEHALKGRVEDDSSLSYVPSVVYTSPEAAGIGLTEDEAAAGGKYSVGFFPLSANGKALASGAGEGFVKIISDPVYGEILGVHIVGDGASEIINEAASLMSMEITVNELAGIVHAHPTVSEALMEAAADSLGCCLHLPPGKK